MFINSIASGFLLMIVLCLGTQNLKDKTKLQLGFTETVPLPTGFVIGLSIVVGVVSGGCSAAQLLESHNKEE